MLAGAVYARNEQIRHFGSEKVNERGRERNRQAELVKRNRNGKKMHVLSKSYTNYKLAIHTKSLIYRTELAFSPSATTTTSANATNMNQLQMEYKKKKIKKQQQYE